jgi:ATP-binding protein involved in chromosome partitioning
MSLPTLDSSTVLEALKTVRDPDLHRDIVTLGFVKNLEIDRGQVRFTIELTTPACPVKDQMREQARAAVLGLPGATGVDITMTANVRTAHAAETGAQPIRASGT